MHTIDQLFVCTDQHQHETGRLVFDDVNELLRRIRVQSSTVRT